MLQLGESAAVSVQGPHAGVAIAPNLTGVQTDLELRTVLDNNRHKTVISSHLKLPKLRLPHQTGSYVSLHVMSNQSKFSGRARPLRCIALVRKNMGQCQCAAYNSIENGCFHSDCSHRMLRQNVKPTSCYFALMDYEVNKILRQHMHIGHRPRFRVCKRVYVG
jgi:hypothetical protein